MLELLAMSARKRTLQEERIVKKKESKFITILEITDSLRVDIETKLKKTFKSCKFIINLFSDYFKILKFPLLPFDLKLYPKMISILGLCFW
jgi:hypothetical protein